MASDGEFGGLCPADATPDKSFSTMCLYAGQKPDPNTGSRVQPIHMSTGFVFKDTDDAASKFNLASFGPIYTRITNPTQEAVEGKIAALEGGNAALGVSSGHAAQQICFTNLLQPGDNFVATNKLYGGSVTQFARQFAQFGWEVRFVDIDDYSAMEKQIDDKTKAVYCEAICNPGGTIVDLPRVAEIAHKHGLPLIVDNTTATPYLCRPFEFGADIVVHSATKYLCGHGNAMGGFIVEKGDFDWAASGKFPIISTPCASYHDMNFYEVFGKDGPVAEMFGTKGKAGMAFAIAARALGLRDCGPCISPMNASLISTGMETLPLRMEKTCTNALAVARFLEKHPKVSAVTYPGLESNPYHALSKKICPNGSSGLFTFSCKGGYEAAKKVVNSVKMISLVANLGDSRTLVAHPASMMHSQLTEEQQRQAGATPEVVRMTIGIEDAEDIIADLDQALNAAEAPPPATEFGGMCPANATPATSFSTMCLYSGQKPDPSTGSRVTPIHMSTAFVFKDTDDAAAKFNLTSFGPIYTRITNPTQEAFEGKIAALEGGNAALACASGHSAQFLCFTNLLQPGDNFVSTNKLYGGSVTQFSRQFAQFGWQVRFVDIDDYAKMESLIDGKTKAIYCESICNPGGTIVDLEKVAALAHKHGLPCICDNTTATPYLCRPFEFGVDIVVHSATKYLCGHGNAMGGFIVEKGDFDWSAGGKFPIIATPCASYHDMNFYEVFGKDGPVAEMFGTKGKVGMAFAIAARALGLRDVGACISPFNASLISTGMETLPLRMRKHCENAQAVAEWLEKHPQVSAVTYPGLKSNPYHALGQKICPKGYSGLFTFSLKGGFEAAKNVVNSVKMISLVANLGDARTLCAHPASMMHRQLTEEQQRQAGASPEVVRMSIGIEDAHDIIADLDQALKASTSKL